MNKKGFEGGRRVAFWLQRAVAADVARAVVKTSGKTGLHVFVPINRTVTFDGARQISEMVGRHLLKEHPKEITMEWATREAHRQDLHRPQHERAGQDAAMSRIRHAASPGATVSMPLTWEELEAAEPTDFTDDNVLAALGKGGRPVA